MIGAEPIRLFGVSFSWLGVSIFLGGLAGTLWAARAFPRVGLPSAYAWTVFPFALMGGCAGAKLWAAIETLFVHEPGLTFSAVLASRDGATFYGGLALGAAAVVAKILWDRMPLRPIADALAPSLAIGQCVGRIGCFLVGDDYGVPTSLPWGMAFPRGSPPTTEIVHPAQLYESAWLLACALVLRRRLLRSKCLIAEYLVLQGTGRFAIELVRTNPQTVGPLTTSQVIALGCVAAGATGLFVTRGKLRTPRGPLFPA